MRKKTAPRARKQPRASSTHTSGLVAKDEHRQPAGESTPLDNRSHRTLGTRGVSQGALREQI
jgi:hypothetical protein